MKNIFKICYLVSTLLVFSSCGVEKPTISNNYYYQNDSTNEIFKNEINNYDDFKNLNENKESYVLFLYSSKGCICNDLVKENTKSFFYNYSVLVRTIFTDLLLNQNTYGIKIDGHYYPSIIVMSSGREYSRVDYYDDVLFNEDLFNSYMLDQMNLLY